MTTNSIIMIMVHSESQRLMSFIPPTDGTHQQKRLQARADIPILVKNSWKIGDKQTHECPQLPQRFRQWYTISHSQCSATVIKVWNQVSASYTYIRVYTLVMGTVPPIALPGGDTYQLSTRTQTNMHLSLTSRNLLAQTYICAAELATWGVGPDFSNVL